MEKKDTDIIYYSNKRQDYIFGSVFLVIAVVFIVFSYMFITGGIREITQKPSGESIGGTLAGFILISLLFILVTALFGVRAYINLFKKVEIARLAREGLFFSEMKGRMRIHKNYIAYTDIGRVYIKKNRLAGTLVVIESNDEVPVPLGYINSFLSQPDKEAFTKAINKRTGKFPIPGTPPQQAT